jgi:hypothetical protein
MRGNNIIQSFELKKKTPTQVEKSKLKNYITT